MTDKPWLVGENNPYSSDPRFDLYCEPERSAGGRLCRLVLGLGPREYLRRFERVNLLRAPRWSMVAARAAAAEVERASGPATLVLLGARVTRAFDLPYLPLTDTSVEGKHYLVLPHPSGRCFFWNQPDAFGRARVFLEQAGVLSGPVD